MICARVIRLFMVVNAVGAVVGTGFGVELGHVVDIFFGQTATVVDGGNFCRQWGEAGVGFFALLVAILCSFAVTACVAFHGWDLWVEFTGLEGQSGDAILTTSGRHYVDGGFSGIHAMFLRVELTEREGR